MLFAMGNKLKYEGLTRRQEARQFFHLLVDLLCTTCGLGLLRAAADEL